MDPNARPRNYQNSAANSGRPSNESRRPPGAPGGPPSSAASSSRSGQSRAERFEDERKRITGSCFSKLEADNTCTFWPHLRDYGTGKLTACSARVLHHPHSNHGTQRLSSVASSTQLGPGQEKAPGHHHCGQKHNQGAAAQSSRERKWNLFDWQNMAHGRLVAGGKLCAHGTQERNRNDAQAMGWRQGFHRIREQALLLGGQYR
jgi:hypothetical protein